MLGSSSLGSWRESREGSQVSLLYLLFLAMNPFTYFFQVPFTADTVSFPQCHTPFPFSNRTPQHAVRPGPSGQQSDFPCTQMPCWDAVRVEGV